MNKKEIVGRLFKDGHISIDELMILLKEESTTVKYITSPSTPFIPPSPLDPPWKKNPYINPHDPISGTFV